jgi:uncharacterized repeat protein (TIGR03803 family)
MPIGDRVQKVLLGGASVLIAAVLTVASLAPGSGASAATLKTLYSFGGGDDGLWAYGDLIRDTAGHLYGTTVLGGHGGGTVFELTPNAAKTKWTEMVLHSFCPHYENCGDGAWPYAGVIMDAAGHLYGTAFYGGVDDAGTVFELTPNAAGTKWTGRVLYSFNGYDDGGNPTAGLIRDAAGHLYGTTGAGGANDRGTVFELTPNAATTKWTETVLYSFCAEGGKNCTDGDGPQAGLIMHSGHVYGTTALGGATKQGTVFELIPNAAKTAWTHKVLYSFCVEGGKNCTDGTYPSGVIMDAGGSLYGTMGGGARGKGGAFELTLDPTTKDWKESVLYSFCALGGKNCTDGDGPEAGVIMDPSGHLYGTTGGGGANGYGTVFELTPNAAKTKWTETVLHSFCSLANCTDGGSPYAGVIRDAAGHLYGTTQWGGGEYEDGTVFELIP